MTIKGTYITCGEDCSAGLSTAWVFISPVMTIGQLDPLPQGSHITSDEGSSAGSFVTRFLITCYEGSSAGSFVTRFLITCYEGSSAGSFVTGGKPERKTGPKTHAGWSCTSISICLLHWRVPAMIVQIIPFYASIPRSSGRIFYFVMKKRKKGDKKMARDIFHVFGMYSSLVHVTDTNCWSRNGSTHSPVGAALKLRSLKKSMTRNRVKTCCLSLKFPC